MFRAIIHPLQGFVLRCTRQVITPLWHLVRQSTTRPLDMKEQVGFSSLFQCLEIYIYYYVYIYIYTCIYIYVHIVYNYPVAHRGEILLPISTVVGEGKGAYRKARVCFVVSACVCWVKVLCVELSGLYATIAKQIPYIKFSVERDVQVRA